MREASINRFEWMKAVLQSEELNPTAKAVASAMAVQFTSDATGQTNPKTTTLRDFLKMSLSAVKRAISDLIKAGWLHRTEGRGNGSKTKYALISPGKIVPFRRSNEAAGTQKKGANLSPFSGPNSGFQEECESSNSGLHRPRNGLSHIEQSYEQYGGPLDRYRQHRFEGNGFAGLTVVDAETHSGEMASWGQWLLRNGLPPMFSYPLKTTGKKGKTFWRLPWKTPPDTDRKTREAIEFFSSLSSTSEARYAAE
ncbi:MAG: helix-turn-helix domain-containing protein [Hoeflea sp. D1-CHI-28]